MTGRDLIETMLEAPAVQSEPRPVLPQAAAGAVILGGAHGAIAMARMLRAQGFAVWLVTDDTPLPKFSNAFAGRLDWPGPADPGAVAFLLEAADAHGLDGYLLIPAADADVRFAARAHEALSRRYHVLVPNWQALQTACDKGAAYQRARELGLSVPHCYSRAATSEMTFPVVLKPTMRLTANRFTLAKAWRADTAEAFHALHTDAVALVGAENVVVQELVPGGGESQFSYAGLWWHGQPVAGFTARRDRQFPLEFSYTSTYVETVELPEVTAAAETFLASIGHHGLVEVEFKRDPRDGALKLLDVNPRPWSWLGLAPAAGVDFGAAIAALVRGEQVPEMRARPNIGWVFLARDLVTAWQMARAGTLRFGAFVASLKKVRSLATFSWRDPLPALIEMPLTVFRVLVRRLPIERG